MKIASIVARAFMVVLAFFVVWVERATFRAFPGWRGSQTTTAN